MDICELEQENWSENGYFVLCFALNSVQMAEPSSCLLWHRQTDLSGSWKRWHLFGRLSDTSVPPSHFCKQMLTGFPPLLWHKYLDPWYLTQVPRHCDVTSYKEVLESLRLNRRALGWLWIVSVPMQIHTPEIASKWLWWQFQVLHDQQWIPVWHRSWEGAGAVWEELGQRGVRRWSLCGLWIQLYVYTMHPRLCFACSLPVDFWTARIWFIINIWH